MARRDQPYLPLYVQDVLTDEKLANCAPSTVGIYFYILCLLHKQETYGCLKMRPRFKQIGSKPEANFSQIITRLTPFTCEEIEAALSELVDEGIMRINDDELYQPRMVRDGEISEARSKAGSVGGKAVRDIPTKKNYNEPGYLYIAEDAEDPLCHKIGISKNLKARLSGLRTQSKRDMFFVATYPVNDMGTAEDNALNMLNDIRDGEWIYGYSLSEITSIIGEMLNQITSKSEANQKHFTENEIENENNSIYINNINNKLNVDNLGRDKIEGYGEKEKRENTSKKSLSSVMRAFQRYINPMPSTSVIDFLRQYTESLGGDLVCHAIDIANDNGARSWPYINAILSNYEHEGVKTLDDALRREAERKQTRDSTASNSGTKVQPINAEATKLDMEKNREALRRIREG